MPNPNKDIKVKDIKKVMANTPTLTSLYKQNEARRETSVVECGDRFIPLFKRWHGPVNPSDKEPA